MILKEYIFQFLIEGRIQDVQKKYPNVNIDLLAKGDPSSSNKYIEWMAKQLNSDNNLDLEEVITAIQLFDKISNRIQSNKKDINNYKSFEELIKLIDSVPLQSKTAEKKTSKIKGSTKIGETEEYFVYRIDTHEACTLMGKGTKWCITEKNPSMWNNYTKGQIKFYFAIKKSPKNDNFDKIAMSIPLDKEFDNKIRLFDAQDIQIENNVDWKEIVDVALNNLPEVPVSISQKIETGNDVSDEEIAKFLEDDFFDQYVFAIEHLGEKRVINSFQYAWPNSKYGMLMIGIYESHYGDNNKNPIDISKNRSGELFIKDKLTDDLFKLRYKDRIEYLNNSGQISKKTWPAIEWANGTQVWMIDGKYHRKDGPAVRRNDGEKKWYINGKLHREDGPAVEKKNGINIWYINGEQHREDGPAVEYPTGDNEYWLHGIIYSEKDYWKKING